MIYFSFAIADSMFEEFDGKEILIRRVTLTPKRARGLIRDAVSCINPSHKATIDALQRKFGMKFTIPDHAPVIKLKARDLLIVASVRGLPRREGVAEYTDEEIEQAEFKFSLYWAV